MFSKKTVSPDMVAAFSDALKKYKQTDAFRLIYQKYFDSPYVAHR
jgi:hypothetical protein